MYPQLAGDWCFSWLTVWARPSWRFCCSGLGSAIQAGLGRTAVVSWLVQVSLSHDGFIWTPHSPLPNRLAQACSHKAVGRTSLLSSQRMLNLQRPRRQISVMWLLPHSIRQASYKPSSDSDRHQIPSLLYLWGIVAIFHGLSWGKDGELTRNVCS